MSSCAVIMNSDYETIEVESTPPGAEVYINGRNTGHVTPADVVYERTSDPLYVVLKKDGYKDYIIDSQSSMSGWVVGNLFFGGLIGLVIDVVSDDAYYHSDIYGTLAKKANYQEKRDNYVERIPEKKKEDKTVKVATNNKSKVDIEIPVTGKEAENTFALIIGNEDYSSFQTDLSSEVNVKYAVNDAEVFKQYLEKTIGVPTENIIFEKNLSSIKTKRAIKKLQLLAKSLEGEANIVVYYAGHGFPDEQSKESYLMPVDVSYSDLEYAVKLTDLYKDLTKYPTKKTVVFLDACFSGGARNQGLLTARGVKIRPKKNALSGNLIVFSASSSNESSLAFEKQQHGMFSYYLLKKLQESKGDVSFKDLADYLQKKVSVQSILVNNKEQVPNTNISPDIIGEWKEMKLSE
jgi:hypothetical protein